MYQVEIVFEILTRFLYKCKIVVESSYEGLERVVNG